MADEILTDRAFEYPVSPMMKEYLEVRGKYEGHIMLYRLGDFYECFFDDAVLVSRELELTLTSRDCGNGRRAAMCGVPFHKLDVYIGRLVERGYKVVVCEQTEDPRYATGPLVKRDVVRVVTPGTVTDGTLLAEGKNNYLCAACYGQGGVGLAFADITTGQITVTFVSQENVRERLLNEIAVFTPAEAIINVAEESCAPLAAYLRETLHTLVECGEGRLFDFERSRGCVREIFGADVDRLSPEMLMAVGALITYIRETQKTQITFVRELKIYEEGQALELDANTRRNLELTESMRTKEKRGSLLWVLDRTKTAMGARLLRSWIVKPLLDPVKISHRQSAVADLLKERLICEDLADLLAGMLDLERLTAKAVYGTANAKDLLAICQSIGKLPEIKAQLARFQSPALAKIAASLDTLDDIFDLLSRAVVDNPPYTVREGGMIRDGYNEDLDYYRRIRNNSSDVMKNIEERERETTGIRTLKVDYNKVFGYYIEVSKSFTDQVPQRYVRKQTLVGCERYITQELKEMENTIFGADEKIVALEFEIFTALRETVVENCERIRESAALVAEVDVFRSFAEVAGKGNYVCPDVDLSTELTIRDGRHPVVEKFVSDSYFVPNDTQLDTGSNRVMIITGPNMAGKSTYMRQVALIVIMAQIGSFVPAAQAHIGIVDKVFTRVGASDDLASGQSTFMLEMNEVANILKNATKRSLIVYDEVGRGTSTFDGMAIARAVVEYTYSPKIGAKTLFATHYHELTAMEAEFPGIVNYNIAAKKRGDGITFLRKIVRGGTDDSYGIEVAKLAGVPSAVVKRAREILAEIESGTAATVVSSAPAAQETDLFSSLASRKEGEAAERLRAADLNTMTPIEAMNLLFEVKKILS